MILGINGGKNWAYHHLEYIEMYRKMEFTIFVIQCFNSLDVNSTLGDQTTVKITMMILDFYKTLEVLGEDKRIDIDNVAIPGWILGGEVALFSA